MAHIDLHITADSPADLAIALGDFVARLSSDAKTFPAASPTADSTSGSEGRPARKRKPAADTGESMEGGKDGSGDAAAAEEAQAPLAAADETAPSAEEPASSASETASGETSSTAAPTDAGVSYDDVRNAVVALAAAKGRDAAIAVLNTFGVDHASKLTEAQWPEALTALTDAQEAE